jgi:two-component system, OmpR family, phosphate regulon sensor histidine kinase PhoR
MKKNRRLIWQIYPSFLILILVSLFIASWYISTSVRGFLLEQTAMNLEAQCLLLKNQITYYLATSDIDEIDRHCKQAGEKVPTRITVILPDGKVVGDSEKDPSSMDNHRDRSEVKSAFSGKTGKSVRYSKTLQLKMMYVTVPVFFDNTLIGVLRSSIHIDEIDSEIARIQSKIAWVGFFIAVFASIICYYIARRITKPIEELKLGADQFASGNLAHRFSVFSTFELSALADAMNKMGEEIENRIEDIETQRNEYESVLSSMTEGVIALDREEHIISINKAATEMLGLNSNTVKGLSIQEAVRSRGLQSFISELYADEKSIQRDISVHIDGERIINAGSSPLFDSGWNRIGFLLVFSDVTRLRQLENIRRDFAANVSHEIKTPLTAIKGFVETLQQGSVDNPEDAQRFLGIIEKHVNRLNYVINDLMSLSKIEKMNGKDELSFDEVHVKTIVETALSVCREKAETMGVRVEYDCSEEITTVADRYLLEQAFVNLLDNAIKYSEKGANVDIRVQELKDKIIVSFKDSGVGISEEHLPRLFERFYRVDKARSRKMGGTGLGLAIVKHIILSHGGHVTVDSILGKGSTFEIHLPVS